MDALQMAEHEALTADMVEITAMAYALCFKSAEEYGVPFPAAYASHFYPKFIEEAKRIYKEMHT